VTVLFNEKELYSQLMRDPEKGLGKIMDTYMGFVGAIAHGKLSGVCGKQDIEECVSDIFYEVYRTRNSIDLEKGSLKSYIAVLAKRKAIDAYRKLSRETGEVSIDAFEHDWIASGDDVEQSVIDGETSGHLVKEIKALGEPDSSIMIRKYYFGQSAKIISKALGLKENTVNKRASRALGKLKEALGGAL
jgi:RNA polymerase sigma-70 factor (ECF subfamily)